MNKIQLTFTPDNIGKSEHGIELNEICALELPSRSHKIHNYLALNLAIIKMNYEGTIWSPTLHYYYLSNQCVNKGWAQFIRKKKTKRNVKNTEESR